MNSHDLTHLRTAIAVARQAQIHGNAPFGALLVNADGDVLLGAENTVHTSKDCTAHAEINLVRSASTQFSAEYLASCTVYASAEPCAMCATAIHWANVGRLVYGLSADEFYKLVGPSPNHLHMPCREVFARSERPFVIIGPLLEDEAKSVHIL